MVKKVKLMEKAKAQKIQIGLDKMICSKTFKEIEDKKAEYKKLYNNLKDILVEKQFLKGSHQHMRERAIHLVAAKNFRDLIKLRPADAALQAEYKIFRADHTWRMDCADANC